MKFLISFLIGMSVSFSAFADTTLRQQLSSGKELVVKLKDLGSGSTTDFWGQPEFAVGISLAGGDGMFIDGGQKKVEIERRSIGSLATGETKALNLEYTINSQDLIKALDKLEGMDPVKIWIELYEGDFIFDDDQGVAIFRTPLVAGEKKVEQIVTDMYIHGRTFSRLTVEISLR